MRKTKWIAWKLNHCLQSFIISLHPWYEPLGLRLLHRIARLTERTKFRRNSPRFIHQPQLKWSSHFINQSNLLDSIDSESVPPSYRIGDQRLPREPKLRLKHSNDSKSDETRSLNAEREQSKQQRREEKSKERKAQMTDGGGRMK